MGDRTTALSKSPASVTHSVGSKGLVLTKSGLCPDDIPLRGTISALRAVDICEPRLADDEAPKPFRFRGFIYPGSYLLSRDLSSDKTPEGSEGG